VQASDVNGDGRIGAIDALIVVNMINQNGSGAVPEGTPEDLFVDVNADGFVSPSDVLGVVNDVNAAVAGGAGGEGEMPAEVVSSSSVDGLMRTSAPIWQVLGLPRVDRGASTRAAAVESVGQLPAEVAKPQVSDSTPAVAPALASPLDTVLDELDLVSSALDEALSDILDGEANGVGENSTDRLFGSLFQ